jgi:hypothetical protein
MNRTHRTPEEIIEEFKNDEFMKKHGAKFYFCQKMKIFQSTLSALLEGRDYEKSVH